MQTGYADHKPRTKTSRIRMSPAVERAIHKMHEEKDIPKSRIMGLVLTEHFIRNGNRKKR